jgi:hypothetical protein
MIKLLDRYILKQFLSTYVFVVALLLAVITVIDLTEKTDKYAKAQLGFMEILGYYGNFLPWIAGLITPDHRFHCHSIRHGKDGWPYRDCGDPEQRRKLSETCSCPTLSGPHSLLV